MCIRDRLRPAHGRPLGLDLLDQRRRRIHDARGQHGASVDLEGFAAVSAGHHPTGPGNGPNAYDCSGLTTAAYKQAGITLPRTSSAQFGVGTAVTLAQLQPGDLVFYYSGISHVGIYIGNGRIVHASNPTRGVVTDSVTSMPFMGGRRIG